MVALSVIICTYNPRIDYIREVIRRLQQQSLRPGDWELVVVDNNSKVSVGTQVDLSWHPAARVVRETDQGLTKARLRGIRETSGDLLCFVDDDNLLDSQYLSVALNLARVHPRIGAFGGSIRPVYEVKPPEWLGPYQEMLAIREVQRELWTNARDAPFNPPCGAGLVVRKVVSEEYQQQLESVIWRKSLDRTGDNLISGGDTDLVLTACDVGLGWGVFPELTLEHLIPAGRLEWDYIMRLLTGITTSVTLLRAKNGHPVGSFNRYERYARWLGNRVLRGKRAGDHFLAVEKGKEEGRKLFERLKADR